ncbi:unnamed protein product [Eruca vesicaria subsp. sativa]|uniref:Phorbol-ester/DAG-type domain-containing protein n=1 Tax=Eruca vesicaria subsp. sativa TaxID=29727 RepID=A0ABC8K2I4_ERUVS|nr:unnamed protein product [Eruca vesicaria subsp. sativa]
MDEVELPSHRHPLNRRELVSGGGESRVCGLCGKDVTNVSAYECSQCYFTAHLNCAENPPSLVIDIRKIHEHTLTLLPRHVSYTCNACGLCLDKSPYVCLKCSFMVDGGCLHIPRVIKLTRHIHRLVYTWFLGPRNLLCGVCHKKVDGNYGAYSCARCRDYAVHTKCATRKDVWDGMELEGVPEEVHDQEDNINNTSFQHIGVRHFSHEHVLKLKTDKEDIGDRDVVCSGCSFPIASDPFYMCQQCDFFLHVTCANLPRRIRLALHQHPLTLYTRDDEISSGGHNSVGLSRCGACDLHFSGSSFCCLDCDIEFDVRCCLVSEPFDYPLHPHPLFFGTETSMTMSCCSLCNQQSRRFVINCIICDFIMCFACATSPDKIKYKYDEHLLHHTVGEDVTTTTNPYWYCDICEREIEEKKHHYKCSDCGPVLHAECALGSFRNMRPGFRFVTKHGHEYEVILNDRTSLLRCSQCHSECHEPLLLMSSTTNNNDDITYLCSSTCFDTFVSV